MMTFPFYGTPDHSPMLWGVEDSCVLESYDDGKTWGCNCVLESDQACWDFISAWFLQFY